MNEEDKKIYFKLIDTNDMLYSIKVRKNELRSKLTEHKKIWSKMDFKVKKMLHKEIKYLNKLEEIELKLSREMYRSGKQ